MRCAPGIVGVYCHYILLGIGVYRFGRAAGLGLFIAFMRCRRLRNYAVLPPFWVSRSGSLPAPASPDRLGRRTLRLVQALSPEGSATAREHKHRVQGALPGPTLERGP